MGIESKIEATSVWATTETLARVRKEESLHISVSYFQDHQVTS